MISRAVVVDSQRNSVASNTSEECDTSSVEDLNCGPCVDVPVFDPDETVLTDTEFQCSACWAPLPTPCFCGSLQLCCDCVFMASTFEAGFEEANLGSNNVSQSGLADVLQEIQRMNQRVASLDIVDQGFGALFEQMRDVRSNMVTRDAYTALVQRIAALEGFAPGSIEESDSDSQYDHEVYNDYDDYDFPDEAWEEDE